MGKRSSARRSAQRRQKRQREKYELASRESSNVTPRQANSDSVARCGRTGCVARISPFTARAPDHNNQLASRAGYHNSTQNRLDQRTAPSLAGRSTYESKSRKPISHIANERYSSDVGWAPRRDMNAAVSTAEEVGWTTRRDVGEATFNRAGASGVQLARDQERYPPSNAFKNCDNARIHNHRDRRNEKVPNTIDLGNDSMRRAEPTLHPRNGTRFSDAHSDPRWFRRATREHDSNSGDFNHRHSISGGSTFRLDNPEHKPNNYSSGDRRCNDDRIDRNQVRTERSPRVQKDNRDTFCRYTENASQGNHRPSSAPLYGLDDLGCRALDEPKDINGSWWEAEIERAAKVPVADNTAGKPQPSQPTHTWTREKNASPNIAEPRSEHEFRGRVQAGVLWNSTPPGDAMSCCDRANDTSPSSIVCNITQPTTDDTRDKSDTNSPNSSWLSAKMTKDDWRQLRYNALIDGSETEKLAFKLLQEILLSPTTGLPVPTLHGISDALNMVPQSQHQAQVSLDMSDLPAELRTALTALSKSHPSDAYPDAYPSERFHRMTLDGKEELFVNQRDTSSVRNRSTNSAGGGETALSNAMYSLADNLLYFFEGGTGRVTNPANRLGAGHQIPVRGRSADRHMLPKSMREQRMAPKFDDNVELDPLYQWLQMARCEMRSRVHH